MALSIRRGEQTMSRHWLAGGIRTALVAAGALSAIFAGSDTLQMVSLDVEAEFPPGLRPRVEVAQLLSDGTVVATHTVEVMRGRATVPASPGAVTARISTPIHDGCELELNAKRRLQCKLVARGMIVPPEPVSEWRLWGRKEGSASFRELPQLPEGWGRGFALAKGSSDLVVARKSGCATMYLGKQVGDVAALPQGASENRRPSGFRVRFVTPQGDGIPDAPELTMYHPPDRVATTAEAAWSEYLRTLRLPAAKDGSLAVAPVPCEGGAIEVTFPERQPVVISPRADSRGVVEIGEIILPRLACLTVSAAVSFEGATGKALSVAGSLLRAPRGLQMPKRNSSFALDAVGPGVPFTVHVFPGEWRLAVKVEGKTFGERVVHLAEGDSLDESILVGPVRVAGTVESKGKPARDVSIHASYYSDGSNPRGTTMTDERGAFEMVIPGAGGQFMLGLLPPSGSPTLRPIDPAKDNIEELRLSLASGETSVVVREAATGHPVSGVQVVLRLIAASTGAYTYPKGVSDESGRVRFSELEEGDLTVIYAGDEKWLPDRSSLGKVCRLRGKDDEAPPESDVLVRAARKVRIRVNGAGAASSQAGVLGPFDAAGGRDSLRSAPVSADGTAEIQVLRDASVLLAAYARGSRVQFFRVESDQEEHTVTLLPIRAEPTLEFRFLGDRRRTIEPVLGIDGLRLPLAWIASAFLAAGCTTTIPAPSGGIPFDQCLGNGSYAIEANEYASMRSVLVAPSRVTLQENSSITLAVAEPE